MVDYDAVATAFFESVRTYIDKRIAPLDKEIKEILARPEPTYCGVWRNGVKYQQGSMVSDHGSLWYCNATTTLRPGASPLWTLAVKAGRVPK